MRGAIRRHATTIMAAFQLTSSSVTPAMAPAVKVYANGSAEVSVVQAQCAGVLIRAQDNPSCTRIKSKQKGAAPSIARPDTHGAACSSSSSTSLVSGEVSSDKSKVDLKAAGQSRRPRSPPGRTTRSARSVVQRVSVRAVIRWLRWFIHSVAVTRDARARMPSAKIINIAGIYLRAVI